MYKFRILLVAFRWPYRVTTEVQYLHMYSFELFVLLLPTVSSVNELASLSPLNATIIRIPYT